jgi:mannose-6-phosphate isomerase-like protein (cupin superfamily)
MQPRSVRRVVTGVDASGRAVVVADAPVEDTLVMAERGVAFSEIWRIASVPVLVDAWGDRDPEVPITIPPVPGGVNFRVVQFDPYDQTDVDGRAAFETMGTGDAYVEGARHPAMHRTDTVDFAVVLDGSITMLLDDDDVDLETGDMVIQRGTNHAWDNRGTAPCRVAFVLVDADVAS